MNLWNCVNQKWQNEIEQEGTRRVAWSTIAMGPDHSSVSQLNLKFKSVQEDKLQSWILK